MPSVPYDLPCTSVISLVQRNNDRFLRISNIRCSDDFRRQFASGSGSDHHNDRFYCLGTILELPRNFWEPRDEANNVQDWNKDRVMDISCFYLSRSDLFLTEPLKNLPVMVIKYEETSERNCSSLVPQYRVCLAKPIIVSIVSDKRTA